MNLQSGNFLLYALVVAGSKRGNEGGDGEGGDDARSEEGAYAPRARVRSVLRGA